MTRAVARLALGKTRPLRNVEKHLRAVDDWAAEFAGFFPPDDAHRVCAHWHLPVDQRLADPARARPDHQRRMLQAMIDAAGHLRAARPADRADEAVYVLTRWPALFMAEVGVFLDPAYGRTFEDRTDPGQRWTRLDPAERSLVRELGLALPTGFTERGYHERIEEKDPSTPDGLFVAESEIWMIGDPAAG